MSFSEVMSLRRDGMLREAYEAAAADLSVSRDSYSCSAMFWVLKDMAVEKLASGDCGEVPSILEQMESLRPDIDDRQGFARRSSLRLAVKASYSCEGFFIKDFLERWGVENLQGQDFEDQVNEGKRYPSLFCSAVRACASQNVPAGTALELFSKNSGISENMVLEAYSRHYYSLLYKASKSESEDWPAILQKYFDTMAGRKVCNKYHSAVLESVLFMTGDSSEEVWRFRQIFDSWNPESFMPEDWEETVDRQGRKYMSLVEKAIFKYQDSMDAARRNDWGEGFLRLLDEACERMPEHVFILRIKAMTLLDRGDLAGALAMYREILKRKNDYYLWEELSECTDDPLLKKSALCRALLSKVKEEFVGKIRLKLASAMVSEGSFGEALHELDRYHELYSANGWKISRDYDDLMQRIPEGTLPVRDNTTYYRRNVSEVMKFIYSDIPQEEMVVTAEFLQKSSRPGDTRQRQLMVLTDASGRQVHASPQKFGLLRTGNVGKAFLVRTVVSGKRADVITLDALEHPHILEFASAEGTLDIRENAQGKQFAVISGIYVPQVKLAGLSDGDTVKISAVKISGRYFVLSVEKL